MATRCGDGMLHILNVKDKHMGNIKGGVRLKRIDNDNKYASVHKWINYHYGRARLNKCKCGKDAYEWALKKDCEYDWEINNFIAMCRSCHNKYDDKVVPPPMVGEKHCSAKLTDSEALEIKERIFNGERNKDIAKDYNVKYSTISKIRTGKQWVHI